jgi:hypothetical protein
MFDLNGKIDFFTREDRAIGWAITLAFAEVGADVAAVY